MKQWNEEFKKRGKIFAAPQENMGEIARLFKKHGVKKILDLGCGSGRHVVYFAKRGFDVYGIDIAEEGIKLAAEWLKKENLNADLKVGNIYERLPYVDNFFDAAISTQTLHHEGIESIRKAVKEIERVLTPGGFVFMTVRKRKVKNFYPKHREIAPRTYVPVNGREKGLPHYLFNKELIEKEFKKFGDRKIWVESDRSHYCFLGRLKNSYE